MSRPSLPPLLLALAPLFACSAPEPEPTTLPFPPASPGASPDPAKPGPFPVGVRTFDLTYEHPERQGKPRTITLEVWYPATDDAKGQPGAEYDLRTVLTEEQQESVKDLPFPKLTTEAVRDARPRRTDGAPYPLVVFSHGLGAIRWQSTFFTVRLASHGYVVVAPDHTGGRLYDVLRKQEYATPDGVIDRPVDASAIIDHFTDLPLGDTFEGMIDATKIGVSGHSFGGFTSLRTAALDARVTAIVPMAPPTANLAFLGFASDYKLTTPTLIEAAHGDRTIEWDEAIPPTLDRLGGPRGVVDITQGGHFTFSDLCAFDLSTIASRVGFVDLSNVVNDGCSPTSPKSDDTFPIIRATGIGFFNATLRGSTGSWDYVTQAHVDGIAKGIATVDLKR